MLAAGCARRSHAGGAGTPAREPRRARAAGAAARPLRRAVGALLLHPSLLAMHPCHMAPAWHIRGGGLRPAAARGGGSGRGAYCRARPQDPPLRAGSSAARGAKGHPGAAAALGVDGEASLPKRRLRCHIISSSSSSSRARTRTTSCCRCYCAREPASAPAAATGPVKPPPPVCPRPPLL